MKRGYKLGRVCPCGTPINDKSKNGVCKPCFLQKMTRDPARRAKVSASLRKHHEDPANRQAHLERAKRSGITRSRNLELCERMARTMREKVQPLSMTPECLAKRDYALTGRRSGESKLSWCPPEYRDEYRKLTGKNCSGRTRMKAADARKLIEAKIADVEAARSGQIDGAVHWLRRLAPVMKQDDGRYRFGSVVLTAGEVVARAKFRGWEPDRLAA